MADYDPHDLLESSTLGVLATIKRNGMPQMSPVTAHYSRERGVVLISTREGLAKVANLRRDSRAAFEVTSTDGRDWATVEGPVTLSGPGIDPDGPEVDALVDYYRSAAGEHPDWEEYRSVMVADKRVLITLHAEKVYGATIRS